MKSLWDIAKSVDAWNTATDEEISHFKNVFKEFADIKEDVQFRPIFFTGALKNFNHKFVRVQIWKADLSQLVMTFVLNNDSTYRIHDPSTHILDENTEVLEAYNSPGGWATKQNQKINIGF